jgi:DNA-binding SARP family transcriptional activator/tetratricopeptide (TPR) repeat protein
MLVEAPYGRQHQPTTRLRRPGVFGRSPLVGGSGRRLWSAVLVGAVFRRAEVVGQGSLPVTNLSLVEFLLLGGVQATADGIRVDLGRRHERCLLGLLLIETGRPITTGRIADLLWNDGPPPAVRGVIQTYVSRIRRRLAPYGIAITTNATGYQIDVAPTAIDLHRFRALVAAARDTDNIATKAHHLDNALTLWRGPLLADVASDELRHRIGNADEELRITAIEQYAETHLTLGNTDLALAALTDVARDLPIREHLVGLLITTLTQAGRKTEAIELYRWARTTLIDELGLEPGPYLQHQHQLALRDEAPPTPTTTTPIHIPRELPPIASMFTGRDAEHAKLRAVIQTAGNDGSDRTILATIYGRGGVGKSALATVIARDVADRFPDGQIYIDLGGSTPGTRPRTTLEAISHALRSLGMPAADIPHTEAEAASRLRSRVSGRHVLFVLDNASEPGVIERMLPATRGCAVIATSRAMLATLDADLHLELDGIPTDDAIDLLIKSTGRGHRSDAAHHIITMCDHLPLAIRVAAARLATDRDISFDEFAHRIADQRQRLDVLAVPGLAVRSMFELSVTGLRTSSDPIDRLAAAVFPRLGLIPVPSVSPEFAASLAGDLDPADARTALSRLVDMQLAIRLPDDRYSLHDLVRLFTVECGTTEYTPDERCASIARGIAHIVNTSVAARQTILRGHNRDMSGAIIPLAVPTIALDSAESANAWIDLDLPTVMSIAEFVSANETAWPSAPFLLADALGLVLSKRSDWVAEHRLAELGLAAAYAGESPRRIAHAHRFCGQAAYNLRRYAESEHHLGVSVAVARQLGDGPVASAALNELARIAMAAGDYGLARQRLEESLAIAHAEKWQQGISAFTANLADLAIELQDWPEALDRLNESLARLREVNDMSGIGPPLTAVSYVHVRLGHLDAALRHYDEAVAVCRAVGNIVDGWQAAIGRGVVHLALGHARLALRDAHAALRMCNEGRPYETAASLRLVSMAAGRAGHERVADDYRIRADDAYARYTGLVMDHIEALLAYEF